MQNSDFLCKRDLLGKAPVHQQFPLLIWQSVDCEIQSIELDDGILRVHMSIVPVQLAQPAPVKVMLPLPMSHVGNWQFLVMSTTQFEL